MQQIKRILCPTDFSECSSHALEQATAWARRYQAQLTVLHVSTVPVPAFAGPDAGPLMPEALYLSSPEQHRLDDELRGFVESHVPSDVSVVRETCDGDVIGRIVEQARALPADLLVMGTHGRSGFARLFLGSVTERVLRQAACPVLTVPRRLQAGKQTSIRRILCPIDFSDPSFEALAHAVAIAEEAGAELLVLHVIELLPEATVYGHDLVNRAAESGRLRDVARAQMAAAIERLTSGSVPVHELLETGRAHNEILRVADEREADLIAIGVHGHGNTELMLFGSTTESVVRQARVPVLTLRETRPPTRRYENGVWL